MIKISYLCVCVYLLAKACQGEPKPRINKVDTPPKEDNEIDEIELKECDSITTHCASASAAEIEFCKKFITKKKPEKWTLSECEKETWSKDLYDMVNNFIKEEEPSATTETKAVVPKTETEPTTSTTTDTSTTTVSTTMNATSCDKSMPVSQKETEFCQLSSKPSIGGNNDKNSEATTILQCRLVRLGYNVAVNGDFGQETADGVIQFQTDKKLKVDGVVSTESWPVLCNN